MEENVNSQTSQNLFKDAAKFGAIIGAIGIVLTVVLYVIDYALLVDWKIGLLMIVLYLGLVIYGGIKYRNEVGGYLSFGKAFQHGYIILIVGGFIGILFSILLYNVIDTELAQKITDVSIENAEAMMQKFGAPEAAIDEAIDKMKIETPNRFTVLGHIKQFGWIIIIDAVLCLITGAIVKKNQPVEM
jgi:hypothetical protein